MHNKYRLRRSFGPWLFFHFFEFWYYYLGAFLCLFALHNFQSQIPILTKDLGDKLIEGGAESVSLLTFFGLALAIVVFRTSSRLLFFYPARIQQKYLRLELLDRLQTSHPRKYKEHSDGQLYQVMFNDINRLRGLVGFGLLQLGNIIIAFAVFIPKITSFNSKLLYAFIPLLVGVVLFSVLLSFFQHNQKLASDAQGEVQNFLIESYEGKQTIKNFHGERQFFDTFNKKSAQEMLYFFRGSFGPTLSIPLIRLSFGISLLYGAKICFDENLGATSLIFFSGFLFLVLEPIAFLSWIGVVFTQAWAGWKRIKELWADLDKKIHEYEGEILFWGNEVPLKTQKNKWIVLCGDTGVGKSYLLREYADRLNQKGEKFSLVAQEPYLFNDSLISNVILGHEKTDELVEKVWELVKIFELSHLAHTKDEVLNLELGENGKKVSGGQAKRIALIRSLISEVDTYLWDDPFSSVDVILEKKILRELKNKGYFKDKNVLLTSHRLTTVQQSHEIYLLDKNGIVEHGEVKELLKSKSKVSEYFEKQSV